MTIIIILSAKREILCSVTWKETPEIRESAGILAERGTIRIVNIMRVNGHPCLVPLVMSNNLESTPSIKTLAGGEE